MSEDIVHFERGRTFHPDPWALFGGPFTGVECTGPDCPVCARAKASAKQGTATVVRVDRDLGTMTVSAVKR